MNDLAEIARTIVQSSMVSFKAGQEYESGWARGFRDGKSDGEGIEQDFAYKSADYENGYWDGWRLGRVQP